MTHPLLRSRSTLSIRSKTYRGVEGFSIVGHPRNDTRRVGIFARTRDGAERIVAALNDDALSFDEKMRVVDDNL